MNLTVTLWVPMDLEEERETVKSLPSFNQLPSSALICTFGVWLFPL